MKASGLKLEKEVLSFKCRLGSPYWVSRPYSFFLFVQCKIDS